MITGLVQFFYPDIKRDEVKKYSLLAVAFLFTIGAYWLLRLLKDFVLYKLTFPVDLGYNPDEGRQWAPTAKLISIFVVLGVVMIYTKLVDMFEKQKLFYIIATFYTCCFATIGTILFLAGTYGNAFVGAPILKYTGICNYLLTESLGSVLVALFWSFTVSISTVEQAKRAFPFIVALGQIGSITGSALMLIKRLPTWPLFAVVVCCLSGLMASIYYLVATTPADQMRSDKEEKKSKPDMLGGIKLLLTEPYLLGVLVVSTFYEISGTIMDYQMKSQAAVLFDESTFKWFLGVFGVASNGLAFVLALLGTSAVIKKFGVRICLQIYPVSCAVSLVALYAYYQSGLSSAASLFWATFGVMMVVKGVSYAVNNPVKEMMYIPTSKDAKFKAKGIIDMLGGRSAKGAGAQIGGFLNVQGNPLASIQNLMLYGSLISLGIIGVWILAALYVGNKNQKLVKSGEIIG
ncbi:MAG TPA: Npt1/Npt2 family nucleotide transporter [Candidatus Saccharimonadales bacterium]|nr:Npt1/Npt2 family nucleotide transporter [Candidatus Saccharimonadales bacterium]